MKRAATMQNALRAAAFVGLAMSAAGCAAYGANDARTPGWFKQRVKQTNAEPFPQLAAVPQATPLTTSQSEWDQVAAETKAAAQELQASPRSAPADMTPEQAAAFEAQARQDAESKRPAH
jgi:hypothetical protein